MERKRRDEVLRLVIEAVEEADRRGYRRGTDARVAFVRRYCAKAGVTRKEARELADEMEVAQAIDETFVAMDSIFRIDVPDVRPDLN